MEGFLDVETLQAVLGRADFVGGIDNEALDFSQLEDFINEGTDQSTSYFTDSLCSERGQRTLTVVGHVTSNQTLDSANYTQPHNLPESPPDSGSEPPYSPQEARPLSPRSRVKVGGVEELLLTPSGVYSKLLTTNELHQSVLTHNTIHEQPISPLSGSTLISTTPTQSEDTGITTVYTAIKKRKLSQDNVSVKQEPELVVEEEASFQDGNNDGSMYLDSSSFQCIRFHPFQQTNWHTLCDHNLKELPTPHYRVDADKGFNFSNTDDAFVCQKKNHFQITCHTQLIGEPHFVKTPEGLRKIENFYLHFYGVKVESPSQTIKVEQSQSDRSKKAFHPVLLDLKGEEVCKVTVGRLHFSETTSNNMRKKGKPNPDQRYFYLVVGLHAHCADSSHYQIASHSSERIIVRASNPGQFENDGEAVWQRGVTGESVFHCGRVGINTERPDEALVVHGNIKLTGHIVQPSDVRAKAYIEEVDCKQQLSNLARLRVVKYKYKPEFDQDGSIHTGLIAQELVSVLPDAVSDSGDVKLPTGKTISNFLVIDKERVFMENIGAVKELAKVTDNLQARLQELERYALYRGSYKKSCKGKSRLEDEMCSDKLIQTTIYILIVIMAVCLVSMAALYFMEVHKKMNMDLLMSRETGEIRTLNELPYHHKPRLKPSLINITPVNKPIVRYSSPPAVGSPPQCLYGDDNCQIFCCGERSHLDSIGSVILDQGSNLLDEQEKNVGLTPDQKKELWLKSRKHLSRIPRHTVFSPYTVVIEGSNFNSTLGPKNCDPLHSQYLQCTTHLASNYTYIVPISKYLHDPMVTVNFRGGGFEEDSVVLCGGTDENCSPSRTPLDLPSKPASSFHFEIKELKKAHQVYRVAPSSTHGVCNWDSSGLGTVFIEFNLIIYRDCSR